MSDWSRRAAARFAEQDGAATPVRGLRADALDALPAGERAWLAANGFNGKTGQVALLPDASGGVACACIGLGDGSDPMAAGLAPCRLPEGTWAFEGEAPAGAGLAWLLGSYCFDRYKSADRAPARLVAPAGEDAARSERIAAAVALGRDLINTPAADLGPAALEAAFRALAAEHGASARAIVGDALLTENYPLIHAVGRAGPEAPRLLDMTWGDPGAPKVTLVGKGVCFDTGGLDLKPSSAMLLMKKDMGGAASVLALADMIMGLGLPVRLRVMVPAVENSVSASSFRPGDVLTSRAGITIENRNTDAEGRLVLADALTEADAETPDLLIDMATLTGAARVALGADVPPFYTDDEALAAAIGEAADAAHDPLWRLPLWDGYETDIGSKIADITNAPAGGMAGSITAALFLRRFVRNTSSWVHFDIYGWNPKTRPGDPEGGRPQGVRAMLRIIEHTFGGRR